MTPDQITIAIAQHGGTPPTPAQVALILRWPCLMDLVFPGHDLFSQLFGKR